MTSDRRARQRLLVSIQRDQRWAAWLEDERVAEFHRERAGEQSLVGTIHLGRITSVDKGLGAAFVDIGLGQAAFLPLSEAIAPIVEGSSAIVQIERERHGNKGPRVTARIGMTGTRLIFLPGRHGVSVSERISDKNERSRLSAVVKTFTEGGEGFTIRTAAEGEEEDSLRDEATKLRAAWREIAEKARSVRPPTMLHRQLAFDLRLLRDHGPRFDEVLYDHRNAAEAAQSWCREALPDVATRIAFRRAAEWIPAPAEILDQIEDALEARASLSTGGGIVIERTEALTAIDVNAESAGAGHADVAGERVLLRTNLAAADEIARQLRLRNIGGIIVVDFIDLKDAGHRRQLMERLRGAVADDPAPVWVGAMSRLGLVELTRKRRGRTLQEMMTEPCTTCEGTGFVKQTSGEA